MENISTNITFSKAKFFDSWVQLDQEQVSYKSILKTFPTNQRPKTSLLALDQYQITDNPNSIKKENCD